MLGRIAMDGSKVEQNRIKLGPFIGISTALCFSRAQKEW
jgi:hypothetical protein